MTAAPTFDPTQWTPWLVLFQHFATLSLLAVGGAITTAPDMHRHLVLERAWLSDSAFSASIALSQAAPGPNVLFVAVLGWHVGLNAAGGLSGGGAAVGWALLGAGLCLLATVLPSSVLSYAAAQWAHRHREVRAVRAFKQGLAPVVVALMLATAWMLAAPANPWPHAPSAAAGLLETAPHALAAQPWGAWLLTLAATWWVWRTRWSLLWALAAGAVLGAMGWV